MISYKNENKTFLQISNKSLFINVQPEYNIYLIAGIHSMYIIYGLCFTISEMVIAEEPVHVEVVLKIGCHFSIQALLIGLLITGTKKRRPKWAIPWLVVTFVVFIIATYYTFSFYSETFLWGFVHNAFSLAFLWFMWIIVYRFHRNCSPSK